ncbi:MAG: hypothetical protein AB1758_06055 [Candidatus Eremiobacterota bacterium]
MPDTFDPTALVSAAECVRTLKEQGIQVSHRLGARVFALGTRGIRFSLAFLEEAAHDPDFLLTPEWRDLAAPAALPALRSLLEERGEALPEGELIHVVTLDEAELTPPPSASLLPAVLGPTEPSRLSGVLWDRRRLEEAALTLLDAEEPRELLENFRYLFRATVSCGQDPTGLLVTALRRGKSELAREVGCQVREHLDRDLGRALEALQDPEPDRVADAVHFLLHVYRSAGHEALVLHALLPVLRRPEHRDILFESLGRLGEVLLGAARRDTAPMDTALEAFLDHLLDDPAGLDVGPRGSLTTFLAGLAGGYPDVVDYLMRRLDSTVDPELHVFYGHVLTRLELDPDGRQRLMERMIQTLLEHARDPGLQENLKLILCRLGRPALEALTRADRMERMSSSLRIFLVHLWHHFRREGLDCPPSRLLADLAALYLRDRSLLLALVRTGLLLLDEVVERVEALPDRPAVILFLLQEAFRMEEPDDEVVLDLLSRFGVEALEPAFARFSEEAALKSAAAATRLRLFAQLARRLQPDEAGRDHLRDMARQALEYPIYRADSLPAVWEGLGNLGRVDCLDDGLRARVVEILAADLENFPAVRIPALLRLYPAAQDGLQRQVEGILRDVLTQEEPSRALLSASLAGLEDLARGDLFPHEAETLVAVLCRTVLFKQDQSLERVMREALSADGQGDGVRLPTPWNREDRETALRILGWLARHSGAPERLKGMVLVRLFSFLQDWMEAIERGRDLYGHRDTPLWEILIPVLDERSDEMAREAALQLLELHRRKPGQLALERRETAQRFLIEVLVRSQGADQRRRGVPFNLSQAALDTLADLALRDQPEAAVTLYLLRELDRSARLRPDLEQRLRGFLLNAAR